MKVLVVAAHPDDEVYGVGGTMARLAAEGHDVFTLVVTDGSSTQYAGDPERAKQKSAECEQANRILGVRKVLYGNLPDMRLDTVPHVDINATIGGAIREIQPDWVFTQHGGDVNLDHQAVFAATLVACRPVPGLTVRRVYAYEVGSSTEWAAPRVESVFLPNVYINVTETMGRKVAAVEAYVTEVREYPHPRSVGAVKAYAQHRGIQVGYPFAEAFILLRELL
jgi:LmbE family N-acetylglucosaminyl deacetylase